MKRPKTIFYIVYFIFHVILLAVAIFVNYKSEDFEFLLKMRANMALMIYVAVAGLILYFINVILLTMEVRNHRKTKEKLESEVNSMKAKMFDLQQASPKTTSPAAIEKTSEGNEDSTFTDKE